MELEATNKGKTNLPFAVNERRLLTIRAERIAPKYLIAGKPTSQTGKPTSQAGKPTIQAGEPTIQAGRPPKVDAQQVRIERYPTHNARYYRITIDMQSMKINVQVNSGNPADDEALLAEITEELLSDNPMEEEDEHYPLY